MILVPTDPLERAEHLVALARGPHLARRLDALLEPVRRDPSRARYLWIQHADAMALRAVGYPLKLELGAYTIDLPGGKVLSLGIAPRNPVQFTKRKTP